MIKKIVFSLLLLNVFILLNSSPVAPPSENRNDIQSHGLGGWTFFMP